MPETNQPQLPRAAKAGPARKGMRSSPHRSGDPLRPQDKKGISWGGVLVGGAGCAFVGYVWNVGGLHTTLDGIFGGWNTTLRGHDALVARWYLAALPVLALVLAVAIVYFMLAGAAGKVRKLHKRRKKRGAVKAEAVQVATPVARVQPSASGMDFVRPVRLGGARDESILVKTLG